MSGVDYEELFRSPLDDQRPDAGWMAGGSGLVAGVLVAVLLSIVLGPADETNLATETAVPGTVAPPPAAIAADFPAGYVEIVPELAAKPSELIRGDETIILSFTTAVKRGSDPLNATWPIGGTWWLEAASGTGVESSRVILGRFSPGVFAVEFPAAPFVGESEFARVMMIERWDHPEITGSVTVPFTGEPFAMSEPVTTPVDQETTLILDELELGRFLGRVAWTLEGPRQPIGRVLVTVTLLDADGTRVGSYGAFPEVLDPAQRGVTEILWQEPFPSSQEGAISAVAEYSVGVVEVAASDLTFDLTDVAIGR
jgi:hypothetical protein